MTQNKWARRGKKRVYHLMPELRRRIPGLFDVSGGQYDRIAEDFGIRPLDVIAETLRDTRRQLIYGASRANVIRFPGREAA
jgi:hypothetical protein